jgi:hypothetical protein
VAARLQGEAGALAGSVDDLAGTKPSSPSADSLDEKHVDEEERKDTERIVDEL